MKPSAQQLRDRFLGWQCRIRQIAMRQDGGRPSPDPRDLYERALSYLQADYFQRPEAFSDRLIAVLPEDSPLAAALAAQGRCTLAFNQFSQVYRLPCAVAALKPGDAARDAAIWHNRLFNPALPETVHVVAFQPDWASAEAETVSL
jgi:hypothetical protein